MRTVTVYSTAGDSRGTDVRSEATTWGQLQSDLAGAQVNYLGMKAIEGVTKHTFESADAQLPEGDFRLFLMPIRTKSGGNPGYDATTSKEEEPEEAQPKIPKNEFGIAAETVMKAFENNQAFLASQDQYRLSLMYYDLTQLAFEAASKDEDPVQKEFRDIAKSM